MGFICHSGANIGDFVTSVAVHTERKVRPGCEAVIPDTAEEFEERFRASTYYHRMLKENETRPPSSLVHEVHALARVRNDEKNRSIQMLSREKSPYQVSFFRQVIACTIR
jgi:ATP-binding cassette subfamily G (WHITE) protein 2 (SNQ2)